MLLPAARSGLERGWKGFTPLGDSSTAAGENGAKKDQGWDGNPWSFFIVMLSHLLEQCQRALRDDVGLCQHGGGRLRKDLCPGKCGYLSGNIGIAD